MILLPELVTGTFHLFKMNFSWVVALAYAKSTISYSSAFSLQNCSTISMAFLSSSERKPLERVRRFFIPSKALSPAFEQGCSMLFISM